MKIFTASLQAPDGTILGIGMGETVEQAKEAAHTEYLLTLYAIISYGHPLSAPKGGNCHG